MLRNTDAEHVSLPARNGKIVLFILLFDKVDLLKVVIGEGIDLESSCCFDSWDSYQNGGRDQKYP